MKWESGQNLDDTSHLFVLTMQDYGEFKVLFDPYAKALDGVVVGNPVKLGEAYSFKAKGVGQPGIQEIEKVADIEIDYCENFLLKSKPGVKPHPLLVEDFSNLYIGPVPVRAYLYYNRKPNPESPVCSEVEFEQEKAEATRTVTLVCRDYNGIIRSEIQTTLDENNQPAKRGDKYDAIIKQATEEVRHSIQKQRHEFIEFYNKAHELRDKKVSVGQVQETGVSPLSLNSGDHKRGKAVLV